MGQHWQAFNNKPSTCFQLIKFPFSKSARNIFISLLLWWQSSNPVLQYCSASFDMGVLGAGISTGVDASDWERAATRRLHTKVIANFPFVSFQTAQAQNKCCASVRMADWFDAGTKQSIYGSRKCWAVEWNYNVNEKNKVAWGGII